MNVKIVIGIVIVGLLLGYAGGAKSAKLVYNRTVNAGTVEGASNCMVLSADSLLSEEGRRLQCSKAFQTRIDPRSLSRLDGRGRPIEQFNDGMFTGTISNEMPNWVVTSLFVELTFKQDETEPTVQEIVEVSGWFEPNSGPQEFQSSKVQDVPDWWGEMDGCDVDESTNCWSWTIVSAWGLRL
jgi:hypothetical protein